MNSPRVRAAMCVLGIVPKDIQPRDFTTPSVTPSPKASPGKGPGALSKGGTQAAPETSPSQVAKNEVFERKRRTLLWEISNLAEKTPADAAKMGQSDAQSHQDYISSILEREKKNIEKLRERSKYEVQQMVNKEVAAKQIAEAGQKKQEESAARVKALLKERDDKLKQLKKEAEKKAEKNKTVRESAERIKQQAAEEMMQKLEAKGELATQCLLDRDAAWEETVVKQRAARDEIKQRVADLKLQEMKAREINYGEFKGKDAAHAERMEAIRNSRVSNAERIRQQLDKAIENARVHQQKKQQKMDEDFLQCEVRHAQAHARRSDVKAAVVKEFRVKNAKDRQQFMGRYERTLKEWEEAHQEMKNNPRFTRSMSDTTDIKMKTLFAKAQTQAEMNTIMKDVVAENRDRNLRALRHSQEQAMMKIDGMRDRVQQIQDGRFEAQNRRFESMKNTALEKHHLAFRVERVKDQPLEKMNKFMIELGLPPLGAGNKEEEEEEKEKKENK